MSLYGNVKKIGSSSFQFDRVYNTRYAMDAAANTDGVYIGRYVLVEYGERFNGVPSGQSITSVSPNNYIITETGVPVVENEEFLNNRTVDLEAYGAVYDSTVWQKIYTEGTERYIMVAELNAVVPKIDMKLEKPVTYKTAEDSEEVLYAGKRFEDGTYEIVKLDGVKEEYSKPSFDTALDTELAYLMHQPTALNFKVDNDFIDFHKDGFNPVYSFGEKEGTNAVAWVPVGLEYTKTGQKDGLDDLAIIENNQEIDTKSLLMNVPALGNTLNTLYNLLYGEPKGPYTNGVLRPYFESFRPNNTVKVLAVADTDNGEVPIQKDGEDFYVEGYPGQTIPIVIEQKDLTKTFTPDNVIIKHWNEEDQVFEPIDTTKLDNNFLVYADTDERILVTIPDLNGRNDDLTWLKDVPGIGDILANNTEGLASILKRIFGYSDPITGQTRFYFYVDWTVEEDPNSNTPVISNKPKVIGGYPIDFIPSFEEFEYLGEDENAPSTIPYNYINTEEHKNIFTGGHYSVDYNTWRIDSAPTNFVNIYVDKLYYAPQDSNYELSQENQNSIMISQNDNTIYIFGELDQLNEFSFSDETQDSGKWIGIDIGTTTNDITKLKWNNDALTQTDVEKATSVGLRDGHIIFWVKAETLPRIIKLSGDGYLDTEYKVMFYNTVVKKEVQATLNILPSAQAPQDSRIHDFVVENQNKVILLQNNSDITLRGNLAELIDFESTNVAQGSGKWIAIDIKTNFTDITQLKWKGFDLTQDDVDEATSVGLSSGHIIFWVKADQIVTNPAKIVLSSEGYKDCILNVKFENTGA